MTNAMIVEAICADNMKSSDIEKFFKTRLGNMRKISLADILPAACHVAATTNNYKIYTLASDIIDEVWMRLKPSKYFRFERVIYSIYWPRIGSVERITEHYSEYMDDKFFRDAMSWIRSLRTISHLNFRLALYFRKLSKAPSSELVKLPRELKGRPLEMRDSKLTPAERLTDMFKNNCNNDALEELAYTCSSVYDARETMNNIMSKDGQIEFDDGIIWINLVLRNNRSKYVRKYVLNRIISERFSFAERDFSEFFMSASLGILNDKEYETLKNIAPSLAAKNPNIKATLKLARENLAIEKFQRESARRSAAVKQVMRQYRHPRHG